jgi:protein TonB
MATRHYQEAYLQRYHINSNSLEYYLFSVVASLIVNTAAALFLVFGFHTLNTENQIQDVYRVNLIYETAKKYNTPQTPSTKKQPKKHEIIKKHVSLQIQPTSHGAIKTHKTKKSHTYSTIKATKNTITNKHKSKTTENTTVKQATSHIKTKAIKLPKMDLIEISQSSNQSIFNWIASHKFYPLSAIYKGKEGIVRLNFILKRNGKIDSVKIIKKSYDDLNKAALKIVKNSSPVPSEILHTIDIKPPVRITVNIAFKLAKED